MAEQPVHDVEQAGQPLPGALLGGITSPVGAVIGGLIVGVTENLVGSYLIASQLKLTVALILIIIVLVFRPNGLFGTAVVRRV